MSYQTDNFLAKIQQHRVGNLSFPNKEKAHQFIDKLINVLFPVRQSDICSDVEAKKLELDLYELLLPLQARIGDIEQLVNDFTQKIPTIYEQLCDDAQAILEFDPAADCLEEVIVAYPGFFAIAVYRFSHELYALKIPILPRLISEYAHSKTGIDIHPGATIGNRFFIDHGTGVVIGETTIIGENVKIYQGVTLGALNVRKSESNTKRHPTIEDNVVIYSGSTILGGETVIGNDSVIGGNTWVTESVPSFSLVYHKIEVKVRTKND
jgi:serine O-acetyltransferase